MCTPLGPSAANPGFGADGFVASQYAGPRSRWRPTHQSSTSVVESRNNPLAARAPSNVKKTFQAPKAVSKLASAQSTSLLRSPCGMPNTGVAAASARKITLSHGALDFLGPRAPDGALEVVRARRDNVALEEW